MRCTCLVLCPCYTHLLQKNQRNQQLDNRTMSNQIGDINLSGMLNNQIATLYMSEHLSDITFYVEGKKIPAHRSIIGVRCEYLNTYFSNALNKPNQTEFELNVSLEPFQVILEYLYTGQMSLTKIKNIDILIQILNLVEEYCLLYLKTHFETYFMQILTVENTCKLLEVAKTYELKELKTESFKLIENNANQILASEAFKEIHKELLEDVIQNIRYSSCTPSELSIFRAISEWCKHANQNIETLIHLVKLPLIPLEELLKIRKSSTLTADTIFDVIEKQMNPNENVVTSKEIVRTIQGECDSEELCQKPFEINYRHRITPENDSCIILELGEISIINYLKMDLYFKDMLYLDWYSYFIEISTDQNKWERIIDYSLYKCQLIQNIYFPAKRVKFIKIVGTKSYNDYFNVKWITAHYSNIIPEIRDGVIVPKNYVTGVGVKILSFSNIQHIQLNQSYHINSIRFSIFGPNQYKKYKFYIETSINYKDWEEVVNKRNEFVTGLNSFQFPSKIVLSIKIEITGGDDRCCEDFRIDNFECGYL